MRARLRWLGLASLFAAALTAAPAQAQRDEPLPRFEDPVCPGVVGLKVEAAESMVGRIRAHAEELGLRLAGEEGCEPNVIVAFLPDGQGFLNRMHRERGHMFDSLGTQERRDLLAHPGPVHVLTQIRTRSRDGMPVPRRGNLTDIPKTEMWMAHSRIYTATRQNITSVLVLISPEAISGMGVGQLADYVTMRALAVEHPGLRAAAGTSILNLFDAPEGEQPAGLTPSALAILSSLYRGLPNLPASARLAEVDRAAAKARAGAE